MPVSLSNIIIVEVIEMKMSNYEIYYQVVEQMRWLDLIAEKLENNEIAPENILAGKMNEIVQKIDELKQAQQAAGLSSAYTQ